MIIEAPIFIERSQNLRQITQEEKLWMRLFSYTEPIVKPNERFAASGSYKKSLKELRKEVKESLGIRRFISIAEMEFKCAKITVDTGIETFQIGKFIEIDHTIGINIAFPYFSQNP